MTPDVQPPDPHNTDSSDSSDSSDTTKETEMTTSTAAPPTETADASAAETPSRGTMLRALVVGLFLDAGLSVAAYGVARLLGATPFAALLVGAVVAGLRAGWVIVRRREVDPFAIFMVAIFVVGLLTSLITGSTRFLLVKESFGTGAAGLAFVLTCLRGKPLAYYSAQRVAAPTEADRAEWAELWVDEPVFRRRFITMSLVIGGALILEALVRVVLVFVLPVDVLVVTSSVMAPVVLTAVCIWAVGYGTRTEQAVRDAHRP